jgi:serine/threonine-protein kinase SRPK3
LSLFGVTYLDCSNRSNSHVALKVITADAFDEQHPSFELDIIRKLSSYRGSHQGYKYILGLIDEFRHRGPNGEHVCLVFKPMGPDLDKYRRLFTGARIPVPMMKRMTKQLLQALSFLHDTNHVIHTGQPTSPRDRESNLLIVKQISNQTIFLSKRPKSMKCLSMHQAKRSHQTQ